MHKVIDNLSEITIFSKRPGNIFIPIEAIIEMEVKEMITIKELLQLHHEEPVEGRFPDTIASILRAISATVSILGARYWHR